MNTIAARALWVYLLFCIIVSNFAWAEKRSAIILPAPQQISVHVYAWIGPLEGPSVQNQGFRMNLGFVVGREGVAVIDSGYTAEMAEAMIVHIGKITSLPIKYVINSNSQPHRFMGNPVFSKRKAKIYAHEQSIQRMAQRAGNFATAIERILELPEGKVKIPAKPDNSITSDTTLNLGGVTINILPFGAAHTPAQLVIEVAEDNVVFAGDLLYSGRMLAVLPVSDIEHWIKGFTRLKEFGDVTFIPGHGQPAKLNAFDFPTLQYLKFLLSHMNTMVEDGVDIQDAINKLDQSAYAKLVNFDQLSGRNASWAYIQREQAFFE